MFKIFSFGFGNIFNSNDLSGIGGMVKSFFNNIDINEIAQQYAEEYKDAFNTDEEEHEEQKTEKFINFQQYDDMYLLQIDLRGIDLRELSIKYNLGVIDINLRRLEIERSGFAVFSNNTLVKKAYNKEFGEIEDIDTNHIMKSIDNGIFSIRMPKKYVIDSSCKIIDVDNYEVQIESFEKNVDK